MAAILNFPTPPRCWRRLGEPWTPVEAEEEGTGSRACAEHVEKSGTRESALRIRIEKLGVRGRGAERTARPIAAVSADQDGSELCTAEPASRKSFGQPERRMRAGGQKKAWACSKLRAVVVALELRRAAMGRPSQFPAPAQLVSASRSQPRPLLCGNVSTAACQDCV